MEELHKTVKKKYKDFDNNKTKTDLMIYIYNFFYYIICLINHYMKINIQKRQQKD